MGRRFRSNEWVKVGVKTGELSGVGREFELVHWFREHKVLATFCAAFALFAVLGSAKALTKYFGKPTYSRQDCLIRVDVIFPASSGMRVLGDSPISISTVLADKIQLNHLPVAGLSHPPDDTKIYLQFMDRCEEKHELTAWLVNGIMGDYRGLAWFVVSDDVISPGWDTMVSGGPWWTDGDVRPPN